MAKISSRESPPIKALVIGDSGTGKTGALVSLAEAGYNVRILDVDNGVDILKDLTKSKPEVAERISFITLKEKYKSVKGDIFPASASVWPKISETLSHWKDGDEDFGPVADWTTREILVIDSLTGAAQAAYHFILSLNAQLMNQPTGYEYQRRIGEAQGKAENLLDMLTTEEIKCNVIVNSHITYIDEQGYHKDKAEDRAPQWGYPTSLGKALSPRIPRKFNSMLLTKKVGNKRRLCTTSHININLKSSAPTSTLPEYDISNGLAEYFKSVRGELK